MNTNQERPSPSKPSPASYSCIGKDESVQKEFIRLCKIIADDPEKLTEGINWWANIITMIHNGCDITRERLSFGKYD